MKYRKKPVVIEAMQFTDETREEVIVWCGAQGTSIGDDGAEYELANIRITTLEGELMACPGDWIIKGIKGEFYPCKPDIFEQTYDAVEDGLCEQGQRNEDGGEGAGRIAGR